MLQSACIWSCSLLQPLTIKSKPSVLNISTTLILLIIYASSAYGQQYFPGDPCHRICQHHSPVAEQNLLDQFFIRHFSTFKGYKIPGFSLHLAWTTETNWSSDIILHSLRNRIHWLWKYCRLMGYHQVQREKSFALTFMVVVLQMFIVHFMSLSSDRERK